MVFDVVTTINLLNKTRLTIQIFTMKMNQLNKFIKMNIKNLNVNWLLDSC